MYPLGLASIAANLPGDHEVRIFDPNISEYPMQDTEKSIKELAPDIIGISIRNIDSPRHTDLYYYFPAIRNYLREVKKSAKSIPIVTGGSGFSLYPTEIMRKCPEIDFGFTGEAEKNFSEFIEGGLNPGSTGGICFRDSGKIVFSGKFPTPEIGTLNSPGWDYLSPSPYIRYSDKSSIGVEAKRGCAFNCAYCVYPVLNGNNIRMKPPVRVVDEIDYLQGKFSVERIFFTDSIFNFPLEHAMKICDEMIKRKLPVKWSAYHHFKFITRDYVQLAREAGCDEFYFSPDAATDKGLRTLGKGGTRAELKKSLEAVKADGLAKAGYNFFAAFPGSGWKDILAAIGFIMTARMQLGRRFSRYKLSYLLPEAGTSTYETVYNTKQGKLPADEKELEKQFFRKSRSLPLNIILFMHFHIGRLLGKRNLVKVKSK